MLQRDGIAVRVRQTIIHRSVDRTTRRGFDGNIFALCHGRSIGGWRSTCPPLDAGGIGGLGFASGVYEFSGDEIRTLRAVAGIGKAGGSRTVPVPVSPAFGPLMTVKATVVATTGVPGDGVEDVTFAVTV